MRGPRRAWAGLHGGAGVPGGLGASMPVLGAAPPGKVP